MVDMASGNFLETSKISIFFSLLVRLIWFCETAELSKSVLSNLK